VLKHKKSLQRTFELHPLERTPQFNEESVNTKVHTAKKVVAVSQ
jgi:hypothetical protein